MKLPEEEKPPVSSSWIKLVLMNHSQVRNNQIPVGPSTVRAFEAAAAPSGSGQTTVSVDRKKQRKVKDECLFVPHRLQTGRKTERKGKRGNEDEPEKMLFLAANVLKC